MRAKLLASLSAMLLAGSVVSVGAAPLAAVSRPLALAASSPADQPNVIAIAGGCGWGHHFFRGRCVPSRYRPYARRWRYPPAYGGVYQPLNHPSPGDHVASELNARQLGRAW